MEMTKTIRVLPSFAAAIAVSLPAWARDATQWAPTDSTGIIVIEKVERPPQDLDDGFYMAGTVQYRIRDGSNSVDTRLPDLARRGVDPDLSYFIAISVYQADYWPGIDARAFADTSSGIVQEFQRDLLIHPETQRFLDWLCLAENAPIRLAPGVEVQPVPAESLLTPERMRRQFGKWVPVERLTVRRSELAVSLTYLTTLEGSLDDVAREANDLQNATYKRWRDRVSDLASRVRQEDLEGFYIPIIKLREGTYLVPVYGVSITGLVGGRRHDF